MTATGNVDQATRDLATAQDIARFANVDLATAADAVAKADAGQDKGLRTLMPGSERIRCDGDPGQRHQAGGGPGRHLRQVRPRDGRSTSVAMDELSKTIGTAVVPVLQALMPALLAIIKAFATIITAILPILIPAMKLLATVIGIVADAIAGALTFVAKLVTALVGLLGPIKDVLNGIGSIHLPFGIGGSSAAPSALGATPMATTYQGGGGGFAVNIYGGDPAQVQAQVVAALRQYTARNGYAGLYGTGLGQAGA